MEQVAIATAQHIAASISTAAVRTALAILFNEIHSYVNPPMLSSQESIIVPSAQSRHKTRAALLLITKQTLVSRSNGVIEYFASRTHRIHKHISTSCVSQRYSVLGAVVQAEVGNSVEGGSDSIGRGEQGHPIHLTAVGRRAVSGGAVEQGWDCCLG